MRCAARSFLVLLGLGASASADMVTLTADSSGLRSVRNDGTPQRTVAFVANPAELRLNTESRARSQDDGAIAFRLPAALGDPSARVVSATLTLAILGADAGIAPPRLGLSAFDSADGVVRAGDFDRPLTFLGTTADLPAVHPFPQPLLITFDVAEALRASLAKSSPAIGFYLFDNSVSGTVVLAVQPETMRLAVTYLVPEPSALALIGTGLSGLFLASRFRRGPASTRRPRQFGAGLATGERMKPESAGGS